MHTLSSNVFYNALLCFCGVFFCGIIDHRRSFLIMTKFLFVRSARRIEVSLAVGWPKIATRIISTEVPHIRIATSWWTKHGHLRELRPESG